DVEDLHFGRIFAARTPREVFAFVTPRLGSVHSGDSLSRPSGMQRRKPPPLGSSIYVETSKLPRMNGWIRQKEVDVPGLRSAGVCQVTLPEVGAPALPS